MTMKDRNAKKTYLCVRSPNPRMVRQDQNIASGIKISSEDQESDETWAINSIVNNANPPPSSTPRIPRVPTVVTGTRDYYEYYVPKVVSIGPYHSGSPKLKFVENLKPDFTMKLLSDNSEAPEASEALRSLYKKLGEPTMVKRLRKFYQEKSTDGFSDKVFTKMMILDGCFIMYYIRFICGGKLETCQLNSRQIVFVHQDLFLLENQIPFEVLIEVMNLVKFNWHKEIKPFIDDTFFASRRPKRRWFRAGTDPIGNAESSGDEPKEDLKITVDHLLQFLHHTLTGEDLDSNDSKKQHSAQTTNSKTETRNLYRCTFRNVNELIDVGINFKPSSAMCLTQIGFFEHWWLFSATVELPPITIDDSTKPMLLNLIAHEMCSNDGYEAWVTSYICLLDSLIDHPEDVKALRKAGVLDNSLGSDNEVANLFNEIGTDLVPNVAAYSEAKKKIQNHYDSLSNTRLSQLKHEYIKSPWAFLALLGAVISLVLSGVQTYFTVWSPKGPCDDLCLFLKMNHRL